MTQLALSDTVIVEDLHWRERLLAMRHLPPDTPLPQPRGPLAQQLLNALLSLPDEQDPLHWLQQEHGQTTALLTLGLTLDLAVHLYRFTRYPPRPHDEPDRMHERLAEYIAQQTVHFGQLLTSTERWNLPLPYTERIADSTASRHLIEELVHLRSRSGLPVESDPHRSLLEPGDDMLLADLLRLPETIDPLQWLQEERGETCARRVLASLVRQSSPTPAFLRGLPSTRSSVHPHTHFHVGHALSGRVKQIDFTELGFLLHLAVRLPRPDAWNPSRQGASFFPLQWKGFERIIDNDGYHYLVQSEVQISNHLWWWQEHLTLRCYPAVRDARELILLSKPTALAAYRHPLSSSQLIPLPGPILGEMEVHILLH